MGAYLIYLLIIILIPLWAQMKVKSTYSRYTKIPTSAGMSGAEVARRILDANGLSNVAVVETKGVLSDHYNPMTKTVHLSTENYRKHSVAGAAVAAHEVGHAIQDKEGYAALRFRHALVPLANISSNMAWFFILAGIFFTALHQLMLVGIILMAVGVLFQIVTLPVEFNASSRAMNQIVTLGLISNGEERDARKVLNAAAMTYVAAAAVAVLELVRMILIYTSSSRD
ncbi:zinc metallopeptidase [Lederbergia galactosidilytica]|uniref:Zn-dependent protease n=1 Tax=Lederbergia galactosidilytica TaxID=217031 RepID=A0A177ZR65_9BACI|nr:zinc metallopeptidase [Lederbergia galactosidilytica]KRG12498.1 Zn-dependent protease [Virgibacillus soli]MBP1914620.1 Zn-dependent membrane protease YugP [Lederbergia galactosidilytica]OAK69790.1 Zn-dependent protease [Lederbergia galactosidilytica]